MAKRFTESTKWSDPWFRGLPAAQKLAWLYVLDNCDVAGVLDIDKQLAEFQMGIAPDWDDLIARCQGRIEVLPSGKWFVARYIEFQYGSLSEDCRAHVPVFASLAKHQIQRVSKGYPKGIQRVQDKDKDKDKDKVLEGGVGETTDWDVPIHLDCQEVRESLEAFRKMRIKIKKPIKDLSTSSRILKQFQSSQHLLACLDVAIANEYQGLKPEYAKPPIEHQKSFGQRALEAQW